jgi:hypothetical protein
MEAAQTCRGTSARSSVLVDERARAIRTVLYEASMVVQSDRGDTLSGEFLTEVRDVRSGTDRLVDLGIGQVGRAGALSC